jgi:hypothetical protein
MVGGTEVRMAVRRLLKLESESQRTRSSSYAISVFLGRLCEKRHHQQFNN